MHHIQSAAIPPKVETAISGVSTPSSIGQFTVTPEGAGLAPETPVYAEYVGRDGIALEAPVEGGNEGVVTFTDIDAERAAAGFLVEWVNPQGRERFCGKASGGISAESVVSLLGTLSRNGVANIFTVTRTR